MADPCGCHDDEAISVLCTRHWNEAMIRLRLRDCRTWEQGGPLRPDDPADKIVLDFYEHLIYWAAKGIGDAGIVGKLR